MLFEYRLLVCCLLHSVLLCGIRDQGHESGEIDNACTRS